LPSKSDAFFEAGEMVENKPSSNEDQKELIRQEWTGAAPLWKKWYAKLAFQSRAATELVVQCAHITPGMHVLDLASGSGEPALSLARSVGPRGRVLATDLVPEMLQAAQENAKSQGLSWMECQTADAERLPFPAAEFDRVTCRFGIMFFPDIAKAFTEQRRVLKPGGRVSFVTWGPPEENPLFSVMLGPILKYVEVPPPLPDAPHVFRFADPAKLSAELAASGFRDVRCTKHEVAWPWPGSAEETWQATSELAAPFKKLIAAIPPEKIGEVHEEILEGIRRYSDGQQVNFPASLVSAQAVS
jgi:ubiquinone/menaquinone biosynthesis C-methylase UbiE